MNIVSQIHNAIENSSQDLSFHTINRHKQVIAKLIKAGLTFEKNKDKFIIKHSGRQIINTIENLKAYGTKPISINYKTDMYSTLKSLHKRNIIQLTELQEQKIQEEFDNMALQRNFSKNTKTNNSELSLEQIQQIVRKATLSPQKVILALLTFAPTRRLEYRNIQLTHRKPPKNDLNYLSIYKNKLVFYLRDYKGSSSKGEWTYTLPPSKSSNIPTQLYRTMTELYDILDDYLKQYPDNKYLFQNNIDQPYEQAQFSQFIINASKQIIGQELSLNYYRHLFTSTYQSYDNIEDQQLDFIADYMGHSRDMQQEYFQLDLAKKSMLQLNDKFEFNPDIHLSLGVFNLFKDTATGTFYAVPYAVQD